MRKRVPDEFADELDRLADIFFRTDPRPDDMDAFVEEHASPEYIKYYRSDQEAHARISAEGV